jgi:FRG domain-containing protein
MEEKITSLKDVKDIAEAVQREVGQRQSFTEFYRGQGSDCFSLTPGIFRNSYSLEVIKGKEKQLFEDFLAAGSKGQIKVQDSWHKDKFPNLQHWFSLFQAQHLGLKTRLLDWTKIYDLALLFAVEDESKYNEDGQFWVFKCFTEHFIHNECDRELINNHPFNINRLIMINYPSFIEEGTKNNIGENRRARQQGQFSIQPIEEACTPLDQQNGVKPYLTKYLIDKDSKKKIKQELASKDCTIDWFYYRKEDNIDKTIKCINEEHLPL